MIGVQDDSVIEYSDNSEFYEWVLMLKPWDVRDEKISERELKRKKAEIRKGKSLNFQTKINRILLQLYKSRMMAKAD